MTDSEIAPTSDEIEEWLVRRFAALSDLAPDEIDVERPFVDYNLDSAVAVTISRDLAAYVGRELPVTLFWEFPTIASLSIALEAPDAAT